MSSLIYVSSNYPLEEIKNPHYKTLSVNEALSIGVEVPDFMLKSDFDRDKPDVLLCSDTELVIDTTLGTIEDGGFDDDFAILKLDDTTEDIYTEKKYRCYLEWMLYTEGRSKKIIEYVKRHLEHTDEIEIWRIWMGNENRPYIKKRTIHIDEFTPIDLQKLEGLDVSSEPITHHCLVITSQQGICNE